MHNTNSCRTAGAFFIVGLLFAGCFEHNPHAPAEPHLIDSTWSELYDTDTVRVTIDTSEQSLIDTVINRDTIYDTVYYRDVTTAIDSIYKKWKLVDSLYYDRDYFVRDTFFLGYDTINGITRRSSVIETAVRIMPLGNSITMGNTAYNSYRRALWHKLDSAGYTVDFVGSMHENHYGPPPDPDFDTDHEGHWGWDTGHILEGSPFAGAGEGSLSLWLQEYTPDIVLIHIGTNNLNDPLSETYGDMASIITTLQNDNPSVTILLATIIQIDGGTSWIDSLNELVPGLAGQMSTEKSEIIIVDQATGFDSRTGYDTWDGVHPNEQGELKMAQAWYDALVTVLD
ncbi:MAG: hypothetical protein GF350_09000 [Chitinivibrionales bacterium]|nr:hypothetical protein [Chitinivibrionales bacterium]